MIVVNFVLAGHFVLIEAHDDAYSLKYAQELYSGHHWIVSQVVNIVKEVENDCHDSKGFPHIDFKSLIPLRDKSQQDSKHTKVLKQNEAETGEKIVSKKWFRLFISQCLNFFEVFVLPCRCFYSAYAYD